jgi:hypothetical protein
MIILILIIILVICGWKPILYGTPQHRERWKHLDKKNTKNLTFKEFWNKRK